MNIKTKQTLTILFVVLVGLLAGNGAVAQDAPGKVEGEVIQVMQQTRTGEPGGLDAVMIRTRQGETMRLLLGESGNCADCVQVGDRIRTRLSSNGASENGYRVRTMKVQRTGERIRFRDASGELLQVRSRDRFQDGAGMNDRARTQDRIHQPGSGGAGAGAAGSRGGGNHGGRR